MTGIVTLTAKNQLTLPASLARFVKANFGSKFLIKVTGINEIVLEKVSSVDEVRAELVTDPKIRKINAKYSSIEAVKRARQMKPPVGVYEY